MPGCAVATCKNTNKKTKGSNVKYFRFPQNGDLSKQWVNFCFKYFVKESWKKIKNTYVCNAKYLLHITMYLYNPVLYMINS